LSVIEKHLQNNSEYSTDVLMFDKLCIFAVKSTVKTDTFHCIV